MSSPITMEEASKLYAKIAELKEQRSKIDEELKKYQEIFDRAMLDYVKRF